MLHINSLAILGLSSRMILSSEFPKLLQPLAPFSMLELGLGLRQPPSDLYGGGKIDPLSLVFDHVNFSRDDLRGASTADIRCFSTAPAVSWPQYGISGWSIWPPTISTIRRWPKQFAHRNEGAFWIALSSWGASFFLSPLLTCETQMITCTLNFE